METGVISSRNITKLEKQKKRTQTLTSDFADLMHAKSPKTRGYAIYLSEGNA
jgi:hypothetical protein